MQLEVLGACVIEKHFTLDKKLPGPDHGASLDPEELGALINGIREIESALGDGIKKPTKEEENIKKFIRKKLVACVEIPRGTIIAEGMVMLKRVGTEEGIDPKYLYSVLGKKTLQKININSPIKWAMIE